MRGTRRGFNAVGGAGHEAVWTTTDAESELQSQTLRFDFRHLETNEQPCNDSGAGQQHEQLPKRQAEQQESKNHESDANGLETKTLSDGRD